MLVALYARTSFGCAPLCRLAKIVAFIELFKASCCQRMLCSKTTLMYFHQCFPFEHHISVKMNIES